jgi:uncharacterized protein with PIN domain
MVGNSHPLEGVAIITAVLIGAVLIYIHSRKSPRQFQQSVRADDLLLLDRAQLLLGVCPACGGSVERYTATSKKCHGCVRKYWV